MQLRVMESHEVDEVDALIRTAFLTALVTDGSEQDLVKRLRSSAGYLPEQEPAALDDESAQWQKIDMPFNVQPQ